MGRKCSTAAVVLAVGVLAVFLTMQSAASAAGTQEWVYYVSYPGGTNCAASEIWRVHPDGSSPQQVLPAAFDDFHYNQLSVGGTAGTFAVSSNGGYIVRVIQVAGPDIAPNVPSEEDHLFVYDLAAGTVRELTEGSTYDQWPTISPDGTTVAFMRSTFHVSKGSDGTYHVIPGEPSIYTVPLTGGTPRRVPIRLDTGTAELSWMPNGHSLLLGTETINVNTGAETPFVHQGRAYYFDVLSSTWTPYGLLYDGNYDLFNPSYGGSRSGRPPSGLYLASHPVTLRGKLLREYKYPTVSPVPNGLFSIQVIPGSHTLVAQYKEHILSGPLSGGSLDMVRVPGGVATRPQLAAGPEELAPRLLTGPPIGNVPSCGT